MADADAQVFAGRIKTFNHDKGWGHIECEETHNIYGKDMFLLRSQLNGILVNKGDEVLFSVRQGDKGPEATNIQLVHGGGCGGAGGQGGGQGQYTGSVKSWNPEKGWGHITCEATAALYGKDVFLLRSQLVGMKDVAAGQQVSFGVRMEDKGPSATDVKSIGGGCGGGYGMGPGAYAHQGYGGGYAAPMQQPQQQYGAYGCGAYGGVQQQWGAPQQQARPSVDEQGRQVYYGTIKSFNEEKGWGHITCEATAQLYGKDMFVMRSALRGSRVVAGMEVMFSVNQGMKGPEAADVRPLSGDQSGMVGVAGREFVGAIKMFDDSKGWGFVACEETKSVFGKDVFVHKRHFQGGAVFQDGDQVRFSVETGHDGRPEAKGVTSASALPMGTPGSLQPFAMAEQQLAQHAGGVGGFMGGGCYGGTVFGGPGGAYIPGYGAAPAGGMGVARVSPY